MDYGQLTIQSFRPERGTRTELVEDFKRKLFPYLEYKNTGLNIAQEIDRCIEINVNLSDSGQFITVYLDIDYSRGDAIGRGRRLFTNAIKRFVKDVEVDGNAFLPFNTKTDVFHESGENSSIRRLASSEYYLYI